MSEKVTPGDVVDFIDDYFAQCTIEPDGRLVYHGPPIELTKEEREWSEREFGPRADPIDEEAPE